MAMQKVIDSPELLNMVLLQLPMLDLLLAQRVNRYFHHLINSAPALQEALFFHAERVAVPPSIHEAHTPNHTPAEDHDAGDPMADDLISDNLAADDYTDKLNRIYMNNPYRVNPLLYKPFWSWFSVSPFVCGAPNQILDSAVDMDLFRQTRVMVSTEESLRKSTTQSSETNIIRSRSLNYVWQRTEKGDAFLRAEANWRRMLICQPPVQRLHVLKLTDRMTGDLAERGTLDCMTASSGGEDNGDDTTQSGLRMGTLYDLTPDPGYADSSTGVGIDWHMFRDQVAMDNTIRGEDLLRERISEFSDSYDVIRSDRSRFPRTYQDCVRLGVIDNGPGYAHEITLMAMYTPPQESGNSFPSKKSDAYHMIEIPIHILTAPVSGWCFGDPDERREISDAVDELVRDDQETRDYMNDWDDEESDQESDEFWRNGGEISEEMEDELYRAGE